MAPGHEARKAERQVFVAEVANYDSRAISFTDRLRSYMRTFYQRSVKAKVTAFLDITNIRGLLLQELSRDGATVEAAYNAVLDKMVEEIETLDRDAAVHAQAAAREPVEVTDAPACSGVPSDAHRPAHMLSTAVDDAVHAMRGADLGADFGGGEEHMRARRRELERRRALARFFVLSYVKNEEGGVPCPASLSCPPTPSPSSSFRIIACSRPRHVLRGIRVQWHT